MMHLSYFLLHWTPADWRKVVAQEVVSSPEDHLGVVHGFRSVVNIRYDVQLPVWSVALDIKG